MTDGAVEALWPAIMATNRRRRLLEGDGFWARTVHKGAPSAVPLRQLFFQGWPQMAARRRQYDQLIRSCVVDELGFSRPTTLDSADAWQPLDHIHSLLVSRAEGLANRRGSAEYLWFLRRLRGQFAVNNLRSTDAYVEMLAEALVCGTSRPSVPVDPQVVENRFTFDPTDEVLDDLYELRELSLRVYEIQSALKRCAKGQRIVFDPDRNPWPPEDDPIHKYIRDYDKRSEAATATLLRTVGLATDIGLDPREVETWTRKIGGMVPLFFATGWKSSTASILADPPPTAVRPIDLDLLPPLVRQSTLDKQHVALIALLWAVWNVMTREPSHIAQRFSPVLQWGYALMPDERFLTPALEEICEWLGEHLGSAIPTTALPQSATNIRETLRQLRPIVWPPLAGNPIHSAGELTVVDVVGSSTRLDLTLIRPTDGPDVNYWSKQFERDVQSIIDNTAWNPSPVLRSKVGTTIKRSNGTSLTDLDAVGQNKNEILLVSCKSTAFTIPAIGGSHNAIRAITDKVIAAVDKWDEVLTEIRRDPALIGASSQTKISGCVVFPGVPFTPVYEHHRRVLQKLRFVCSSSELESVLRRSPRR